MRTITFILAIAIVAASYALADEMSDESVMLEVSASIDAMKKKGATEADCKELAKASCQEVTKEHSTDQRMLNRLETGVKCNGKGQAAVIRATKHWIHNKRVHHSWVVKLTRIANSRVRFTSQRFGSLKFGKCGFIFRSRDYLKAKAIFENATRMELKWKAIVSESFKMVTRTRKIAARQERECHCTAKKHFYSIVHKITSVKRISLQNAAYAKCKMMSCVLSGTNVSSSKCKGRLSKLRVKKLNHKTQNASCHKKGGHKGIHHKSGHGGHHHLINYGKNGADWGVTENKLCGIGKRQSPVNVNSRKAAKSCKALKKPGFCGNNIKFRYGPTKIKSVVNNGHTVQVNFAPGNSFTVCGETFPLVQLHFHSRSEDELNNHRSAMEMHLVHVNKKYKLPFAVIGVWLYPSRRPTISGIEHLFKGQAKNCYFKHCRNVPGTMNPMDFLPKDKSYYRFLGGFTTPPCTEGVRWFELKKWGKVSATTVLTFRRVMEFKKGKKSPSGNYHDYREIQKTNGRAMCTGRL